MSVRFVIGRAGSGKTWRCLEAVRARLREDATEGSSLFLLVPEQASFQVERTLIEMPDIPGYTRCEVLSFQRLAYRIFAAAGADPRRGDQTIGSLGRMMVIRRLIRRERSGLRLLDRVADKPGLVAQLARALDELMREEVAPATLAELAERHEENHPLVAAKLADVARLYQAYLDYLAGDRIDPAQYLQLAADRLDACPWLDGAEVWVDGFAGFTHQELHLLTAVAQRVAHMEITLLVDPAASAVEASDVPPVSYSLFARTERTLVRLRQALHSAGVNEELPIRVGDDRCSRFAAWELKHLERRIFSDTYTPVVSQPQAHSSHVNDAPPAAPRAELVRVLEFPHRRAEVEAAVAEVVRLTRQADPPMRYRDIAVIVRDLTPYHDLLSAALRANGIPCFVDRRQPTTTHPLVELVRSLLAMAGDDCRLESVRLSLKAGLLPISPGDSDLLENYLIAHGIAGLSKWSEPWTWTRMWRKGPDGTLSEYQQAELARINGLRRAWLDAVGGWLNQAQASPEAPGRMWAEALYACLERIDAGGRLCRWSEAAEADGRTDEADAHRQVWTDFIELIDEFVGALGTETMTVQEFRETIDSALAEFSLGLAPPTLDQVLVSAIERSRHPTIRAALLLGFDEASYPMRRSEDALLGDEEREALESGGAEIGPSRRRKLLDERMLAYIAMTRASERLWISSPRADEEGKPLRPSPFVEDVLAALPGLRVERMEDPRVSRSVCWVTRVADLGGRLAGEFRYRKRLPHEDEDPACRAVWNGIYDAARRRNDWQHTLKRGLAGLAYRNDATLQPGTMEKVVKAPFCASVSQLERFAACPFAYFADYVLRLQPRREADLADVDLGTLCHRILEVFVSDLVKDNRRLATLDDDAIAERIDAIAGRIMPELAGEMMLGEARNAFLFDRSRGHMRRVTQWQRDAARVGRFRPLKVEYPFGFSGDSLAPLTLTTPGGRTVLLRGIIDRVDVAELGSELAAAVIDYKRTTERKLNLAKVYHGLALQLVGYLLALQQNGRSLTGRPVRPVAALYLPLIEPYQSVAHPGESKSQSFKFRGIVDAAAIEGLDDTVAPGTRSQFIAAGITKEGRPHKNSDLAESDQFAALMQYVGRKMGTLADSLLDGNVQVAPYRLGTETPCGFCEYRCVCRYESELQKPNDLDSLMRTDVLDRIVQEGGE